MSIRVTSLTKSFGQHAAVNDITFDIPTGVFFCVVGPSGCGKSTLLRLVSGLETPDRGTIALDGETVFGDELNLPPEGRKVGVVFQSYALWPHLSVLRNVSFPYEAQGVGRAEAARQAAMHLGTVSLSEFAQRKPEALSGGQRQRVALARCLAGDARTILMDEPLANLDPHLRHAMEAELRAFHDRSQVTTLYITHDQREAMALADLMAVMDQGRFLQVGTPQEIYDRPQNSTVARFIGRGTLLSAEVAGGRAAVLGQNVPVLGTGNGACRVFVRPEQVKIEPGGWPATVTSVAYRGGHWEVAATGRHNGEEVTVLVDLNRVVRVGEPLFLGFSGGWIVPD